MVTGLDGETGPTGTPDTEPWNLGPSNIYIIYIIPNTVRYFDNLVRAGPCCQHIS